MRRLLLVFVLIMGLLSLALSPAQAAPDDEGPPSAEQADFEAQVAAEPAPAGSAGYSGGVLGTSTMRRANRAASKIVEHRMRQNRPNDLLLLRQAGGADVVVVSGSYDRVQDVLRAMQVKHVVIPPRLVGKLDLLATQTLMINCPGHVSDEGVRRVREFVHRGGFLVTTDWALAFLTQKAFPKTIKHNGRKTPNDVVSVHMHDAKEPLLAHVKLQNDNPRWWLEASSFPIKVLDQKRVKVLMSSPEMKKKYGDGAVAVTFHAGQGRVLHMTSHFFLQQSKLVAAKEKKKGSGFAKQAGMSAEKLEELKKEDIDMDKVTVGDLNSAYSMQQFSTNLLVSKQKANKKLLERYQGRVKTDAALGDSSKAKPGEKAKKVKKGFRVEVLERKDGKVKVRDLFGHEGWVSKEALL